MYVYESFEKGLWTVGHYDAHGKWHPSMQAAGECRAPLVTIVWWCARQIVRAWVVYAG